MVKLGIIGLSEGNGHPFSFSSIINGYDPVAFEIAGWPGILNYLNRRDRSELASFDARVTHVWTQDRDISEIIANATFIKNIVDNYTDMLGEIDALIIARDDFSTHYQMALPFLQANIPVFVDKPLTLNLDELVLFKPFIESGLLMSCSGFRFCSELDSWRTDHTQFGTIKLIQANVINGWDKYGIHMLDAILSCNFAQPLYLEAINSAEHESVNIFMNNGSLCQINALGRDVPIFSLSVYGSDTSSMVLIKDNFTSFRRTLFRFIEQVKSRKLAIESVDTLLTIRTLIAGRMALDSGKRVYLDEVRI